LRARRRQEGTYRPPDKGGRKADRPSRLVARAVRGPGRSPYAREDRRTSAEADDH